MTEEPPSFPNLLLVVIDFRFNLNHTSSIPSDKAQTDSFPRLSGKVQAVLRRHWNQYNLQFSSSVGNHSDALRSASYTASSITEVQGCYSIDGHSEHMNGKGSHDADASVLRSENTFA